MCHLPLDIKLYTKPWHWVCEAFAVWVETLFEGVLYLSDARRWCDHPERPLRECAYDAFPFMTYLMHRLDRGIFKKLWYTDHDCDPWKAILKIVEYSSRGDEDRFFADYCLNSYFPYNSVTRAIFERFGHRQSVLISGSCVEARLEPLACRYYRVGRHGTFGRVRVIAEGSEWANLQVSAAQVLDGPSMGKYCRGGRKQTIDLVLPFDDADEVVLAVTNDRDDRQSFALRVELR